MINYKSITKSESNLLLNDLSCDFMKTKYSYFQQTLFELENIFEDTFLFRDTNNGTHTN